MKKEKITQSEKSQQITDFIQKWKINVPLIAKTVGMPVSVFKNKLYQSQPSYFFTDLECVAILCAISEITADIKRLSKTYAKESALIIPVQKVTNYPEN